jgi:hypothetical protein
MRESDLYGPVKRFLAGQGYDVKGEVGDCDVYAVRDDVGVAVELKGAATLKLVLQAVSRMACADEVYLAIPDTAKVLSSNRQQFYKLLRLLGIGLLAVDLHAGSVCPLLDPTEYRPRKSRTKRSRLLGEHAALVGDPNEGGSHRRKGLMTAYRQKAIRVAGYLLEKGPCKVGTVREDLSEPRARQILYGNVYGWFERRGTGVYALSPRGERELPQWTKRG